jgi:hypothetical protein
MTMSRHPIGTPRGTSSNAAMIAVGGWLSSRGLCPPIGQSWSIEVALDVAVGRAMISPQSVGTSFQLRMLADEWSYTFCHDGRVSSIRVADVPSVHDRDDHQLLASTPPLKDLASLIRKLEQRYGIHFQRRTASVRTTLTGAEPIVLSWAQSL